VRLKKLSKHAVAVLFDSSEVANLRATMLYRSVADYGDRPIERRHGDKPTKSALFDRS